VHSSAVARQLGAGGCYLPAHAINSRFLLAFHLLSARFLTRILMIPAVSEDASLRERQERAPAMETAGWSFTFPPRWSAEFLHPHIQQRETKKS